MDMHVFRNVCMVLVIVQQEFCTIKKERKKNLHSHPWSLKTVITKPQNVSDNEPLSYIHNQFSGASAMQNTISNFSQRFSQLRSFKSTEEHENKKKKWTNYLLFGIYLALYYTSSKKKENNITWHITE